MANFYGNTNPAYANPYGVNNGMTGSAYYNPTPTVNAANTFIWVQGEEAAKAYPVAPNSSVILFDSENPVLYIKQADATGRPLPMQIYDMVERGSKQETATEGVVDYGRIKQIVSDAIDARLNKPGRSKPKREVRDDA